MNKRSFKQLIVILICAVGLVDSEDIKKTGFAENSKNTVFVDTEVGLGILYGIRYERVLTQITNVEIGLSPISVYGYRGMIIPLGANVFLPFGNKHKIAVMFRTLLYVGRDPGVIEKESHSFTAEFNSRQPSLFSYGLYYQFKSEYSIIYRFGVGAIITEPIISASFGYNF